MTPKLCKHVSSFATMALCGMFWLASPSVNAQTPPAAQADPLADSQKVMADRLAKLEDLLLRSAELEAADNPTRAALLQQAVQLSKQAQLADTLSQAADHLVQKQFSEAIDRQKASRENLKRLLELLLSENREERVREKRDQVTRWIEETERLLRMQNSLRGRTEGGQDAKQAAADQEKLSDRARQIEGELGESSEKPQASQSDEGNSDQAAGPEQPPEQSAEEPAEATGEPNEGEPNEGEPNDGEPKEGEPKEGSGQNNEAGEPKEADVPAAEQSEESKQSEPAGDQSKSDGKQSAGKPQQGREPQDGSAESQSGESSEGQSQSQQSQPGNDGAQPSESGGSSQSEPSEDEQQLSNDPTERARQRIEQARRRMQEAQQELEKAERDGAVEKQIEAEKQLRQAIEELTEILRQLREEEIERSLASLESRLRKMLELQNKVLDETKRLQEIAGEQGTRQIEIRANSLSMDERKILAEGGRAYLLLREEGSSAAFPEAVEQLNTDIGKVVERLEKADVGNLTVVIQQEIVSSLEEMVEALVKIQKENQEKKEQQQQQNPGQQQSGEQPLVDKLAEIRLIRTLQVRINKRTEALSQMLTDPTDPVGQAAEAELVDELRGLGERQDNLQRVTRDIVLGTGE